MAAVIEIILNSFFECAEVEELESVKPFLEGLFSSIYLDLRRQGLEVLKKCGIPEASENCDCLYAGLSSAGRPFMISVSSTNNFELQVVDQPFSYLILNQVPEIVAYVQKVLSAFLGEARGKCHDQVWDLAQRFLPGVIQKIAKRDPVVSENGDLIFLTKAGVKTFEFAPSVSSGGASA
jgi:hypothetical protein